MLSQRRGGFSNYQPHQYEYQHYQEQEQSSHEFVHPLGDHPKKKKMTSFSVFPNEQQHPQHPIHDEKEDQKRLLDFLLSLDIDSTSSFDKQKTEEAEEHIEAIIPNSTTSFQFSVDPQQEKQEQKQKEQEEKEEEEEEKVSPYLFSLYHLTAEEEQEIQDILNENVYNPNDDTDSSTATTNDSSILSDLDSDSDEE